VFSLQSIDEAVKLIAELDSRECKLNPESKRFIKGRLRNEVLGVYIQGIHFIGDVYKIFIVKDGKPLFVHVLQTRYGAYYPTLIKN